MRERRRHWARHVGGVRAGGGSECGCGEVGGVGWRRVAARGECSEINGEGSIDSIFDLLSKEIEKTAVAVN